MEDDTANNRESKTTFEYCSPDTSSSSIPKMKRSHSDTVTESSSSSKVEKRRKHVHFADPSESSSSPADSDSRVYLQNGPSFTSRWTEEVTPLLRIQMTQDFLDMHNVFLQGCLHFVPDTLKCAEIMDLFMSKEDNVYECYKHVLQNVFTLHCDDISTVNFDDIKEMEEALADPQWIKSFADQFQNRKFCRRTLKDIARKLQQFVWQLIHMVRTHRGQEGEEVPEGMYQELFVLFAKTFGLHILSGCNVKQYGLIAGESGRFVAIPDALICHPLTDKEKICAVVQVTECNSSKDNSLQRSSSPHQVGSDLQSKHVGLNLCVLPHSVFGERGMFGIVVDRTKVTISVFKTDSSYYQKLCNGFVIKHGAAVTFSKQYNILRKEGRTECIQTFLHLKKLLEHLSNKSFP